MTNDCLYLEIGGITFTILLDPPLDAVALEDLYKAFMVDTAGDWQVRVTMDDTLTNDMPPWVRHEGAVTHFQTMSHQGWVDLDEKAAQVSTPASLRIHSALVRVLSFVLMQMLPRRNDGLLLHGAGIVFEGKGHVFFGASGRGKSTVSRLARGKGQVLTDENVLIRPGTDGMRLHSTPFWGLSTPAHDIHAVGRRDVPLVALYALDHTAEFQLHRLSQAEAVMALLTSEKVATERTDSAAAWLAMASRIVANVPVYRLGFRPTYELWDFLAEQSLLPPLR